MNAVTLAGTTLMHKWPGFMVCGLIALAATFVSEHYGGPQLIYALLMGLAFHFLYGNPQISAGVDFCGRTLLRVGVALLGVRITVEQVVHLGWKTAAVITCALVLTILVGIALSSVMGRRLEEGVLSGGAVAICGASAALAISSVLPQTRENERITLLTVVGVTVFSTFAMVSYPFLLRLIDLNLTQSGIFLGGTIHDVAQVVAAGVLLGPQVADTATVVKLFRVLLLMPVVLAVSLFFRRCGATVGAERKVPLVPIFLMVFVALILVSSTGVLPASAVRAASDASRWLLVLAIAAAGVKTSFEDILQLGWQPIAMLLAETVFIATVVAVAILVLNLGVP